MARPTIVPASLPGIAPRSLPAGAGGRASSGRARPALSRGFRATAGGGGVVGLMVLVNAPAAAVLLDGEDETKESGESSVSASLPFKMDGKAAALGKTIGLGAVMGYCAGYSMKKVGKVAAVGVGVLFISVQVCGCIRRVAGVAAVLSASVCCVVASTLFTDTHMPLWTWPCRAHHGRRHTTSRPSLAHSCSRTTATSRAWTGKLWRPM